MASFEKSLTAQYADSICEVAVQMARPGSSEHEWFANKFNSDVELQELEPMYVHLSHGDPEIAGTQIQIAEDVLPAAHISKLKNNKTDT